MDQFKQFNNSFPQQKKRASVINQEENNSYETMPDGSTTTRNFTTPPQSSFDGEEMKGSMQKILADNLGEYVVIEFLIGTERLMRKQGLLYSVGTSYITLYDDQFNNFIVCDIFSIKFVYFYYPGDRPHGNYNVLHNPPTSMSTKNNR